ncbi:MAG: mismatch-specific DNA-glycosylase, partial [Acidimicrobiales bacterium]|nr:mismatch-specific DNA-glycosylase [Acidimicrobiales bacterium]
MPKRLALVHGSSAVGDVVRLRGRPAQPFGGGFTTADLVAGAGFEPSGPRGPLVRARTLPDRVGPGLRLLVCGLNPSLYAADAGVGFARPGNRFWPALIGAGLTAAERDRRPELVLEVDRIGFTDLVKRATRAADELEASEYVAGAARLERLVRWLGPGVVCFLGLSGYRRAIDPRAAAGPLPDGFAGRPAYLMGNPSGLNAHSRLP